MPAPLEHIALPLAERISQRARSRARAV